MQLPLAKYMQVKCTCKKVCIDLTTAKGSLFDVINRKKSDYAEWMWLWMWLCSEKNQLKINSLSERTFEIIQKSKHSHAPTQL